MRLALVALALSLVPAITGGQAADALLARAKQERTAFIKTLQELVSIQSGSRDIEGLNRLSELIAARLRALGGDVQFVAPGADVRFDDTPKQIGRMVLARFTGTGTRPILLLAHMDTVYERGMARSSRSASTATVHTGSASPTTSRALRSSCTRLRHCRR